MDKIKEFLEWLDSECPNGTTTFDLSHDFAENLRNRLEQLQSSAPLDKDVDGWKYHKAFHDTDCNYHKESWSKDGKFVYNKPAPLDKEQDKEQEKIKERLINFCDKKIKEYDLKEATKEEEAIYFYGKANATNDLKLYLESLK